MDLQEVLAELSKLGRANMQDFVVGGDDTADVIESLQALPREHAAAIQELTIDTYMEGKGDDAREVKRVKLKLHDKRGSLAELRRHLEPVKHEHSGGRSRSRCWSREHGEEAAPAKKGEGRAEAERGMSGARASRRKLMIDSQ
jgi:hypothetical protein